MSMKLSQIQLDTVSQFMKVLFEDDVQAYWDMICEVDQARIYGMYKESMTGLFEIPFHEYIANTIKPEHENIYEELKDQKYSLITHLRHSSAGDVIVHIIKGGHGLTYAKPTELNSFPVWITVDALKAADQSKNPFETSAIWRVRIYTDHDYKQVTS